MNAKIDELLDVEYAAQQEEALTSLPIEINRENEKKIELRAEQLLVDISDTLRLMNEQMIILTEVTKDLPETVLALKSTTEAVQEIAKELPVMVREQCLAEYKMIFANAVKNYNQLQNAIEKWQRDIKKRQLGTSNLFVFLAVITPLLVILNLLLK